MQERSPRWSHETSETPSVVYADGCDTRSHNRANAFIFTTKNEKNHYDFLLSRRLFFRSWRLRIGDEGENFHSGPVKPHKCSNANANKTICRVHTRIVSKNIYILTVDQYILCNKTKRIILFLSDFEKRNVRYAPSRAEYEHESIKTNWLDWTIEKLFVRTSVVLYRCRTMTNLLLTNVCWFHVLLMSCGVRAINNHVAIFQIFSTQIIPLLTVYFMNTIFSFRFHTHWLSSAFCFMFVSIRLLFWILLTLVSICHFNWSLLFVIV